MQPAWWDIDAAIGGQAVADDKSAGAAFVRSIIDGWYEAWDEGPDDPERTKFEVMGDALTIKTSQLWQCYVDLRLWQRGEDNISGRPGWTLTDHIQTALQDYAIAALEYLHDLSLESTN